MECAWISNFVTLETEALLTFCQEEYGVGSERARAGAGLKAGFLRQKNIRTKDVCTDKNILFFCPTFCGVRVERAHRVQKEAPSYRRERPKGRGCARALRGWLRHLLMKQILFFAYDGLCAVGTYGQNRNRSLQFRFEETDVVLESLRELALVRHVRQVFLPTRKFLVDGFAAFRLERHVFHHHASFL